ncbi:MAG: DUF4173 domain-containing protein [Oscillospiraceae bacterium]|nr:DUF4173 domain-containing protein [Oscillospiraceae bacterium]
MDNLQNTPNIPSQDGGCPQPSTIFNGEYQQPYGIPDLPTAQPIKKRTYTVFEGIIAVVCFVMGFLFMHYCLSYVGGIFTGAFWALFGVIGAVFAKLKKLPVTKGHVIVFVVAELFCFVPLFSANMVINTLAAFFVFGLYCYLGLSLSGAKLFGERFVGDMLCSVFARPFASYGECPKAAFGLLGRMKSGKSLLYVFVGLLIAVPLTIVVAALLISSDAMFEDFMADILDKLPRLSFSLIGDMFWGVFVAMFLGGILFSAEKRTERSDEAPKFRFIPLAATLTAVTPICVFYLAYLIIQLRYLTAAFGGSLPEGVSYSDFARDGFFELCVVASINLVVILLMQAFTVRRENDRRPGALTVYTVMISVFTLLLIVTAVCKMFIYIGEYGMTPLRVYTTWFMALLAIFFVIIILWQFVKLPLWRTVFAAFTVMFAVLCFSNTDGFIARYNVEAYHSGALSEVDMSLLRSLEYAAVPAMIDAAEAEPEAAEKALTFLAGELEYDRVAKPERYAAYFSLPRARAEALLKQNTELYTNDQRSLS